MARRTYRMLVSAILSTILLIGFSNCKSPSAPDETINLDMHSEIQSYALHESNISSAEFNIYVNQSNNQTVNIHYLNVAWAESLVTWNSFFSHQNPFNQDIEGSYQANEPLGWRSTDITGMVKSWISGTKENHGLFLSQTELNPDNPRARFDSRENSHPPHITITRKENDDHPIKITAAADVLIWGHEEDWDHNGIIGTEQNWANEPHLNTGDGPHGGDKKSLLRFNFNFGCTQPFSYWKSEIESGDNTGIDTLWTKLSENGKNTKFFELQDTYSTVLLADPGNDEYSILAQQYITALLNMYSGANISEVTSTLLNATSYFEDSKTFNQNEVLSLAETLEEFNTGVIGPGSCTSNKTE